MVQARNWILAVACVVAAATPSAALFAPEQVGVLASNAATDVSPGFPLGADDARPAVASDGAGTFVAVWVSQDDIFADSDFYHVLFSRSEDGGRTWSPAQLIAATAIESRAQGLADVAYALTGTWLVAWSNGDEQWVVTSSDSGASWSAAVDIDDLGRYAASASTVAGDASGTWVVVWRNDLPLGGGSQLYYSRSIDHGASWTPMASFPNDLIAAEGGFYACDIATDDNGTWVAVFDSSPYGLESSRSTDGGATWSLPESISLDEMSGSGIGVAPDGGGNWVAAWTNGIFKTTVARSSDDGQSWGSPVIVGGVPSLEDDGGRGGSYVSYFDGAWQVAWQELYGEPSYGVGREGDILGARSFDGVTWTDTAALNVNAGTDNAPSGSEVNEEITPALASGADGSTVLVYRSTNTLGGTLGDDPDIFYARADKLCPSTPSATCATATRPAASSLLYKNPFGARDKFQWRWRYGAETLAADFGNPTTTTDYALCVYDKAGGGVRDVMELQALAGKACKTGPCWSQLADGSLRYRDPDGRHGPLRSIQLLPGAEGEAGIRLKAAGPAMMPAPMPFALDPSLRVQLVNAESGACWEAVFSTATTNLATEFRGTAD